MRDLIKLYLAFFKIGSLTFGGGYAMLPMIQREIVEKNRWATEEEVMNYYAVGQCTPGVIAVNTATFIGYFQKGIPGSLAATLGVITPSIIIISVIAGLIQGYSDAPIVEHAFSGITAAVAVLILNAVIKLWKSGVKDVFGMIIFGAALVLDIILEVPTIYIVIASIFVGIMSQLFRKIRKGEGEK